MKSDARGRDGGVRQALAEGVKFTGPDAPSAASSWSGTRQVLYSITKHAMRRSANEIGQLRFHFGRKCLAIRHRLLTEFFPPIESARQESNLAHGSLERADARPRGNDAQRNRAACISAQIIGRRSCRTNLREKPRNAVCLNGIRHDDDSPDAASSDAAWTSCLCEIR